MQRSATQLLSALPELLEPYESVDASGGTVRRFAFAAQPAQLESRPDQTAPASPQQAASSRPAAAAAAVPGSEMQAELTYLLTRFGSALTLQPASNQGRSFRLTFVPSDPAWHAAGLTATGSLSAAYPAAGSWHLDVLPGLGVSEAAAGVLGKLLAHEGQAAKAKPLRAVTRHLDSRANELILVRCCGFTRTGCGRH